MAKAPKVPVELTLEEKIIKAKADFFDYGCPAMNVQVPPSRLFDVGQKVLIGHLEDVTILEVLNGGLAYVYRALFKGTQARADQVVYRVDWWFNIDTITDTTNVPNMMSTYRRFHPVTGYIDTFVHLLNGGIVCDPEYQRGYVWTDENKDALLDTIFERCTFGSFLFVRHAGFNHKNDITQRHYKSLSGADVSVAANEDYLTTVIDGQQRLTTILDFVLDRRAYRGVYFSQMSPKDRYDFLGSSVQYTIIDEVQTNRREILRMFLQTNRGVPQQPEHLAKVQALYDAEQ